MDIFRTIYDSIKKNGLRKTIIYEIIPKICNRIIELAFDIKYGTDTTSHARLEDLKIESSNKERGVQYEPTNIMPLKRLFNNLKFPKDSVFVDLGCGKGRVLLVASEFGFKEVRGIEFSGELCTIAKNNCSNYQVKTGIKTRIQIVESDVVDYIINDDENVFFLFHSFNAVVLNKVLENITVSLTIQPRKIWIVYRNPEIGFIIAEHGSFDKLNEFVFWGDDFTVYSNIID